MRVAIIVATIAFLSVAIFGAAAVVVVLFLVALWIAAREWMSEGNALRVIGDVSRYLDVAPVNIDRRHEILKGGIDLLSALHAERSDLERSPSMAACTSDQASRPPYVYDRIVVVGHSLGSIIAYEILKHYWARVNHYLTFDEDGIPPSVTKVARCQWDSEDGIDGFQRDQFDVWRDLGRSKEDEPQPANAQAAPRWLITDFVTIGSPLTYAPILMADSAQDFNEHAKLRELPLCPPDRSVHDNKHQFAVHLLFEAAIDKDDQRMILHHAAPFAATRWTNFYFRDDPIGGPLANVFGFGVKDIEVEPASLNLGGARWYRPFYLHTRYWPESRAIPELQAILKGPPDTAQLAPSGREWL